MRFQVALFRPGMRLGALPDAALGSMVPSLGVD